MLSYFLVSGPQVYVASAHPRHRDVDASFILTHL